MRYVTGIERRAIAKGREEGLTQGLAQGLIEAIEMGLDFRFGQAGIDILPEIEQFKDNLELLRRILTGIKEGSSLEEIQGIYTESH